MTAHIIDEVKMSRSINQETCGKHRIIAFMDDIKVHSQTYRGFQLITEAIERTGMEVGLHLNQTKSGMFVGRHGGDEDEEGTQDPVEQMFLPEVRDAYKYLGIYQLERDTAKNVHLVKVKIMELTRKIFSSDLAVAQKARLYNTAAVPALVYVLGNLYSTERASTIGVVCREMDKDVRMTLAEIGLRTQTTSIAGVYIAEDKGGLGLRSLEDELEVYHVRRGAYLEMHPEIGEARERYRQLKREARMNPISDMERILQKYKITVPPIEVQGRDDVAGCVRQLTGKIRAEQSKCRFYDWIRNRSYVEYVDKYAQIMTFPALKSLNTEDWMVRWLHAAQEERVMELCAVPHFRHKCLRGCAHDETAYHVAASCVSPEYVERHDFTAKTSV